MTTINSIDDLLRLLDENEQFLAAVRHKILTEELIRLPHEFGEFQKEVKDFQKETKDRFDGIDRRFDGIDERLDGIDGRLDTQHALYSEQNRSLDRFRGAYAMEGTRRYRRIIARTIARARGNRLSATVVLDDDELNLISSNAEDMDMSDIYGDTPMETLLGNLDTADLVLKVTENNRNRTEFYVAIEASYTVEDRDIAKSTSNAKLIARATGKDAYAVVAGASVRSEIRGTVIMDEFDFVKADDPNAAFWHEVELRDMQPDAPR